MTNPASLAANIPVEVAESEFPIVVERYGLVADSGGAGLNRGGLAVERVWRVKPDLTREGGSIPVTLTFEQATGKNVLLLPMGSSTDAAHSINEKLDKQNYIEGIKLLGAYLHYAAEEPMTG